MSKLTREEQREKYPDLQEREWVPLWLAGPLLAVVTVFGIIGLIHLGLTLWSYLP